LEPPQDPNGAKQDTFAIYELSREAAIAPGYWTGDPGDDLATLVNDPLYSYDEEVNLRQTNKTVRCYGDVMTAIASDDKHWQAGPADSN
jgi:hypothetical protein